MIKIYILTFILLLSSIFSLKAENLQSVSRESLLKELQETEADAGLVILLKDKEIAVKVNLIQEDGRYKEGNEEVFHQPKNTGTLLTTIPLMCILDSISPSDTVDVGNGIYIKDGKEIRDHNADWGGYGVLNVEQVLAFDSYVGITKLMEKYPQALEENFYKMGFSTLELSPLKIAEFYDKIAHEDTTLCPQKVMENTRRMLEKVVTNGTGKNLDLEEIKIAGKTGKSKKNEVSCCVYFETGNSLYTCLVILSNPKRGIPSGGTMCGNVVKEIVNQLKEK